MSRSAGIVQYTIELASRRSTSAPQKSLFPKKFAFPMAQVERVFSKIKAFLGEGNERGFLFLRRRSRRTGILLGRTVSAFEVELTTWRIGGLWARCIKKNQIKDGKYWFLRRQESWKNSWIGWTSLTDCRRFLAFTGNLQSGNAAHECLPDRTATVPETTVEISYRVHCKKCSSFSGRE